MHRDVHRDHADEKSCTKYCEGVEARTVPEPRAAEDENPCDDDSRNIYPERSFYSHFKYDSIVSPKRERRVSVSDQTVDLGILSHLVHRNLTQA